MTLEIETIPCLSDNYAYLAHDPDTGMTAAIDVPEAAPILAMLDDKEWLLSHVLITHHHADHVDGLPELLENAPARVIGAAADAHRLPPLDIAVEDGDTIIIGNATGHVMDVSGHTVGHIAFHFPESAAVFTADSLMALGCGRVFEGTMEQMWDSLSKLAALPPETTVYSGHEYTQANAAVDAARAKGHPTVPSKLSEELATNPFLRAADPAIQANLDMTGKDPAEVFAEIRRRKDRF